jgi:hypothetical protein
MYGSLKYNRRKKRIFRVRTEFALVLFEVGADDGLHLGHERVPLLRRVAGEGEAPLGTDQRERRLVAYGK